MRSGRPVRTLTGTKDAGINRIWWDLKFESSRVPHLRTIPIGRPDVGVGPDGTRPMPGGGPFAPLVPPGTYTVKLKVGGTETEQAARGAEGSELSGQ